MLFSKSVLPAPLGPIIAKISPDSMSKVTFSRMVLPSKETARLFMLISFSGMMLIVHLELQNCPKHRVLKMPQHSVLRIQDNFVIQSIICSRRGGTTNNKPLTNFAKLET